MAIESTEMLIRNLLTNEALDPAAKIPEFKFCAVMAAPVHFGS